MTIPADLDEAFALLNQKAAELDAALDATEVEQAAGRTGHQAYLRAQRLADELKEFGRVLTARIEEERRTL
ncbi:MAG: hypothetical protein EOP62_20710 [Sphingomonadales bacterium]|nr:MAG: hypothetical protein EOP62_20710 [Sphingomonadales bacterium]